MERLALFVDQNYRPIVVGVLNVQGLTRFLGAEIAAAAMGGVELVVV